MLISLDGTDPIYIQIFDSLRGAILAGTLPPGERLPSTRALASDLGVSRNAVLMAFSQLFAEGYVEGRVGAGTFVAGKLPDRAFRPATTPARAAGSDPAPRLSAYGERALREPIPPSAPSVDGPRFDFRYGMAEPDGATRTTWRRMLARAADESSPDYAGAEGHPALREAIARYMGANRGVACSADQVLVLGGSQQGLDLISRVLVDPGDRVVLEEPHYPGARHAFRAAGATLVPIPVDDDGLDVAAVPAWASSARLVHVTPSHQFPTGALMPLSRRLSLLEWAARHDAHIVEDDYDSEYRYEGRPVGSVQGLDRHGRTLYLGTFSKTLFPALRLGFLVAPPSLVRAFRAAKWLADRHSPTLEQVALARFMEEGHFERHLRRMRRRHASRRAVLLEALGEHLAGGVEIVGTGAGIHLWLRLPAFSTSRLDELVERAARRDVGVYTDRRYHTAPPRRSGLLLGYGNLDEPSIREGIRRLSQAIEEID